MIGNIHEASWGWTTRLPPDWTVKILVPFRHYFSLKTKRLREIEGETEKYTQKKQVHS